MNCSKAELIEVIRGQVVPRKSTNYTDGRRAYDGLVLEGYKHHRIHHHDNEFARKHRHINGIESFWSYAKMRLAKLRGVRWQDFYDHLKETEWRFNHRHDNLFNLLITNLESYLYPGKTHIIYGKLAGREGRNAARFSRQWVWVLCNARQSRIAVRGFRLLRSIS